tara:strand:- start:326 stop:655 length:330 start_codon:yes stop_codon:yes gene_type:complete
MNKFIKELFLYALYSSYVLYFIVLIGITSYAPQYLNYIRDFLKYYVGILLVILYNPLTYKERKFEEFDRKLVFSAGLFILLSTSALIGIEQYIRSKTQYIINKNISSLF